jgi:hypothetical protein
MTPSTEQVDMMAHATGSGVIDRNYYRVGAGSPERVLWDALVAGGFAVFHRSQEDSYHVSRQGLDYLYGVLRVRRENEPEGTVT